jgi:large subunit ribosomal protein L9e
MKTILKSETLAVPDGVTVTVVKRKVNVSGPRGKLFLDLSHLPIDLKVTNGGKTVSVERWFTSGKQAASIHTAISHVSNMFTGVTKGFKYKMRFVYAHFPINVAITKKDTRVEIRNFLGEKVVRIVDAQPGVIVKRSTDIKDEIVLEGNDIQAVSRTCALIQQICAVKRKDIRKFLDGIYVSGKGTCVVD